ncbi:glycosyltransferase family 1 protein [Alkalibacterium psychrotolerans]
MNENKTNAPLRICHILGKMNGGGVESMVMNYYRHIDKNKIQFDFVVDEDSSVIPFEEITSLGGRVYMISPYQKLYKYNQELNTLLRKNQYNIIHSHINSLSVFPLSTAKRAGVPIRIAHSHSTAAPGEIVKNLFKYTLRPMSKVYPTHYCSCSKTAGEWLFGKRIINNGHLNIVTNGIDLDKFRFNLKERESIRDELNITDKYVIGHTGRLSFQKNQEFLITLLSEIITKIPNAVLLLLGDGKDYKKLIKQANELGLTKKILFLGNKPDVHRYYSTMDIFAFPSRYEGLGISAVEAQVSGMPVLLSNKVPKEAGYTDNCHFLSINDGVKPWIDAVLQLNKEHSRSYNVHSQKYEIKENVEKLEAYYFNIIKERV